ncbi:hypothetical protein BDM02DRAFT_3105514 [Thelephora ganbajun]|uniref:Uncharacterized protein n=1 Tax=Thelephora ganbajun TaxID=370292 RepID=A0ACB6YZC6_THEGA|nr:hypothetical protein BDM02DRAFT_3105514 [Thelephora ganbajun]
MCDDNFVQAYQYGIFICFADQVICRVFPRFFAYMADYPEKVLLACIRNLGTCPCPRCLIKKIYLQGLGTRVDIQ